MSMKSWTACGYGFPLFTGTNGSKILEFLKNHEASYKACMNETVGKKVYAALDELEDNAEVEGVLDDEIIEDGLNEIFDWNTASEIASVINQENNLRGFEGFTSDGACATKETVMYVMLYPWQMTDKEKTTTHEQIDEICKKYCEELGIPTDSVGDQELEYYG